MSGDTLKLTNVPVPPPLPAAQQPTSQAPSAERWLYRSSYIYRSVSDAVNPNETSVPDYVRFQTGERQLGRRSVPDGP